jgi:hypothetical protein
MENRMPEKDVHTEHCCIKHGCKYTYTGYHGITGTPNPKTCTVESGEKKQSFMCEHCEFDLANDIDTAYLMNEMFEAGHTRGYNEAVAEMRSYDDRYLR